ncbi:19883_t:CDS:10 [Cetraspora pellucida]|uniref:19883_t:CDS:1 n=1 Tax=Cetraspora pellucida TaxID=1433469 RepID=A0A9N8ZW63_9GLOM|nr:19883_t:CDS:10 [Cetraspora pellucida]
MLVPLSNEMVAKRNWLLKVTVTTFPPEATKGEVEKIVYDGQLHSATIFLDDGNNYDGNFFDTPGVVLISKEMYQKTINNLANIKGKESIIIEDVVDVKIFIIIDYNEQGEYFNDFESNEEPDKLLPNFHSTINITQSVSVISEMLENTTLASNITQLDKSRDNDHKCEKENSRKSKHVYLENHQRAKKNKRLKSDKIYKQVDISDSDNDSQNSDSDDKKSTPHRVEITSFPIVVVEQNEHFSRIINNTQSISQPSNLIKLDESSDEYSNTQEEIDKIRFNEAVEYEINSAINNENTVDIETSFSLDISNDVSSSVSESHKIRNEVSSNIDQTSSNDSFSEKNDQIIEDSQIEQYNAILSGSSTIYILIIILFIYEKNKIEDFQVIQLDINTVQTNNGIMAESDHDDISVCGSTTISKHHKAPFHYAEKLKNLRKNNGKSEIFESNPGVQDEMYSKPIKTYFTEDTASTSFGPLPNLQMDITNCLEFLYQ